MTVSPVPISLEEPTGIIAGRLTIVQPYPPYSESPVQALSFRRRENDGTLGSPYGMWLGHGENRARLPVGDWEVSYIAGKATEFRLLARARLTAEHTENAPLYIDRPLSVDETWSLYDGLSAPVTS